MTPQNTSHTFLNQRGWNPLSRNKDGLRGSCQGARYPNCPLSDTPEICSLKPSPRCEEMHMLPARPADAVHPSVSLWLVRVLTCTKYSRGSKGSRTCSISRAMNSCLTSLSWFTQAITASNTLKIWREKNMSYMPKRVDIIWWNTSPIQRS